MFDYNKIHSLKTNQSARTAVQVYHLLAGSHQNRSAADFMTLFFLLQNQRQEQKTRRQLYQKNIYFVVE